MKTRQHHYWLSTINLILARSFAIVAEDTDKHIPRSSRVSVIRRAVPPLPSLDDPPGPIVSQPIAATSDDVMSVQIPSDAMMSDAGFQHQLREPRRSRLYLQKSKVVAYLTGKIKLTISAAKLARFSACVKPGVKAGIVNITDVDLEDVNIGSQLFVKADTADADRKEVMILFNLTTTEANKTDLAGKLAMTSARKFLKNEINENCNQQEMIAGGSTSYKCTVESIELDGIVTTTTTTIQQYLAVGGPNFVVQGHIQLRIHPKQDISALKVPICKGVAHSTGQPPQACQITGYESEHNKQGEEEINFAFNLTILDTDYGKVAKSIDYYKADEICNTVRWECQNDKISPEAVNGSMAVRVVEYSCNYQDKSRAGFIGLIGELVVDIGDASKDIVGDYTNDTDNGDPVTKRYVRHAFSDALMASTNNALDSFRLRAELSKASGNNINFTFEYLNQENLVDADVGAVGKMDKALFDKEVVDTINQFMDADHQVTAAAIKSGYVKKITEDDPRIIMPQEDSRPPPCHESTAGGASEKMEQVCGTFMMDSNAAEDFENDQKMQEAVKQTIGVFSCGDAEEMTMSILLTQPSSIMPKIDTVNLLAKHTFGIDAKMKSKLRHGGPDGHKPHSPGQSTQEMKVGICIYVFKSRAHRIHFMMKHLPLNGVADYLINLVKKVGEDEGFYTGDEDIQVAIKSANVTEPASVS